VGLPRIPGGGLRAQWSLGAHPKARAAGGYPRAAEPAEYREGGGPLHEVV